LYKYLNSADDKPKTEKKARAARPDIYKGMNSWLSNMTHHPESSSGSIHIPMRAAQEAAGQPIHPSLEVDQPNNPQSRLTSSGAHLWKSSSAIPSNKDAFKRGFLLRCAEEGLDIEQIHTRIKQALDKSSSSDGSGWFDSLIGKPLGHITDLGLAAGIGIPIGAGVIGGAAYNRSKPQERPEDLKHEDIRNEYYRLADAIRRKTAIREMQKKDPGSIVRLA
jgi:hypothetical protein